MTIKFRVRNALSNELIGYEFIGENGWWYFQPVDGNIQVGTIANFTDFIREQFVGVKDANGQEIYYNDIVKVAHPKMLYQNNLTTLAKVEYDETNGRFELSEYRSGSGFQWDIIPFYEDLSLEVLGDTYKFEKDPFYFETHVHPAVAVA